MDSSKAKAMLAKYDADGSGEMDFAEFKALCDELRGTGSKAGKPAKALEDFEHLIEHHGGDMDAKFRKMVDHNVKMARKALKK